MVLNSHLYAYFRQQIFFWGCCNSTQRRSFSLSFVISPWAFLFFPESFFCLRIITWYAAKAFARSCIPCRQKHSLVHAIFYWEVPRNREAIFCRINSHLDDFCKGILKGFCGSFDTSLEFGFKVYEGQGSNPVIGRCWWTLFIFFPKYLRLAVMRWRSS